MKLNRIWLSPGLGILVVCLGFPALAHAWQVKQEPAEESRLSHEDSMAAFEAATCPPEGVKYKAWTDKKQHPTPEAPEDKALIYVLRPTGTGRKIKTTLAVDGTVVGINRGNNYFFFTLDPGKYYFCSQAENPTIMQVIVEAGQPYYFQQKTRKETGTIHSGFVRLNEEEGKAALANIHPSFFKEKN